VEDEGHYGKWKLVGEHKTMQTRNFYENGVPIYNSF